ncbi:nose resistant to fluoxetine protein 6-like isoform X2 [Venturia canescens]|uniref:nose resistant to fluoxetine protein 6-like isoform X2 n=1 Tax=Venturia canescens TaxID=32260 RepID=UPI001C9D068A|nr:nose resistant to fluoxetine protein 6-like isoform X2 [Venturia canescens]
MQHSLRECVSGEPKNFVLDSSGEPKSGFLFGNNYWLGSQNQCNDVANEKPFLLRQDFLKNASNYRKPDEEFPPFGLHYFVAHFRHNSTLQYHVRLPNEDLITLGLCLPASCTTEQLSSILETMFEKRTLVVGDLYAANFQLESVRDLRDDHTWLINARIIIVASILVLTLILMIVGTAYDVLVHQKYLKAKKFVREAYGNNNNNTCVVNAGDNATENVEFIVPVSTIKRPSIFGDILQCFSVYTNTKILFSTKLGSDAIAPIHGLRFLGMIWIVIIHTIFYMADYADNKPWSWRSAEGFAVQIISNATLSVDTYFFLGGFLVAYLYYKPRLTNKNKKKRDEINYGAKAKQFFSAVFSRFVRLTPAYMMMVGIMEINASWYGKTSQFYMTERPQDVCVKYWWRNLLYINNLFGRKEMCLSWSWYLSNDMQFFMIGTFLVILSSMYFYTAVSILLFILVGSTALTGFSSYAHSYVPTMDQQYHMLDLLYDPPWTRIGPYIVGIITAYVLVRLKNKLVLGRKSVMVLWLLGSSCNLLVLFGLWERQISPISSALYVALSRAVWGVGLSWLLIACCTNRGGIINKILSFRGWIPLSRLTFSAYLLNPFIINSIYLHGETSIHVDMLLNGMIALGNLMATYVCSYVYSLMMETPYVLLMRLFSKPRTNHR